MSSSSRALRHRQRQKPRMPRSVTTVIVAIVITILSSSAIVTSAKETQVEVNVYSGPTSCNEKNKITTGNVAALHYTASIAPSSKTGEKGRKIISSLDQGFAQAVTVGRGKVIQGLDIGLLGLCKGSKASLIIPPHLAYGEEGNGPNVPGGATIEYDVEIIDVQPEPPPPKNEFAEIDANRDGKLSKREARDYFAKKDQPIDIDGLWTVEDKNKDGFISWQEFSGSKGDTPPGEKQRTARKTQQNADKQPQQSKSGIADLFEQLDVNKDGKLSRVELSAVFKELGQVMTDEFWEESDEDKDGYVSWEEFIGSNGDGTSKKDEL